MVCLVRVFVMEFCEFMESIEIRDGWIVTYHGFNLRLLQNWEKDLEDSKLTLIESIVTVLHADLKFWHL